MGGSLRLVVGSLRLVNFSLERRLKKGLKKEVVVAGAKFLCSHDRGAVLCRRQSHRTD
jgi:hypothetical protein